MVPYAPGWLSLKRVVPVPLAYALTVTAYGETCPWTAARASILATAVADTGIDVFPNTFSRNVGAVRDTVTVNVSEPVNCTDTWSPGRPFFAAINWAAAVYPPFGMASAPASAAASASFWTARRWT
jgi:hypothetical protein